MRAISAIAAFLFCGAMSIVGFVLVGETLGWLTVHGETNGPGWWRLAYAVLTVTMPGVIGALAARAAWKASG